MKNIATRRRVVMGIMVPLAVAALAGCAANSRGAPASLESEKTVLLQRAKAYWALVLVNDSIAAWPYESASKDKSLTLEAYVKRGGVAYDAVEVRSVRSVEGDAAVVELWMRYSVPILRLKNKETMVEDRWERIDGIWYHSLRRSSTIPDAKK